MSRIRRRMRPEGMESPKLAKQRALDEAVARQRTCSAPRIEEGGFVHDYHEPKHESDSSIFTWDPKLRRSVTPVECKHCGRKGLVMILEVDDRWEDPFPLPSKEKSREKHSCSGQVRCEICAPLRCSKAS